MNIWIYLDYDILTSLSPPKYLPIASPCSEADDAVHPGASQPLRAGGPTMSSSNGHLVEISTCTLW
jgi:hypothetical protein